MAFQLSFFSPPFGDLEVVFAPWIRVPSLAARSAVVSATRPARLTSLQAGCRFFHTPIHIPAPILGGRCIFSTLEMVTLTKILASQHLAYRSF